MRLVPFWIIRRRAFWPLFFYRLLPRVQFNELLELAVGASTPVCQPVDGLLFKNKAKG